MKSQSHTSQLLKYIVDHLFPFSTGLSFLWIMIYSTDTLLFLIKKQNNNKLLLFFRTPMKQAIQTPTLYRVAHLLNVHRSTD